jgi:hypothetical protein
VNVLVSEFKRLLPGLGWSLELITPTTVSPGLRSNILLLVPVMVPVDLVPDVSPW